MLSIFLCACWSSVCLLWRNVYSDPLSPFNCLTVLLVCLGFVVVVVYELYAFFLYFLYKLLIGQIVYKYLVPLSRLLFHLADRFLHYAEAFQFGIIPLILLLVPLPVCVSHSFVSDSVTTWSLLSMEFSRQDNWSGLPFPCLWRRPKNIANTDIKEYTACVFFQKI